MRSVAVIRKNLLLCLIIFSCIFVVSSLSLTYVYINKIHPASDRDEPCACAFDCAPLRAPTDLIRLSNLSRSSLLLGSCPFCGILRDLIPAISVGEAR